MATDSRQTLERVRQGATRLRQGLAARSALDKLRKSGVRVVPDVETLKAIADAEHYIVDDAFSGSRMFAPRVVLLLDTGEGDDSVVNMLHGMMDQGMMTAKDVLLLAGEFGAVDYARTEAFVPITFEAAMAINEKKGHAALVDLVSKAQATIDAERVASGLEYVVSQNLMVLVLRHGADERYPLIPPQHFLYRLHPELESAGVPIEFDDDPAAMRGIAEQVQAHLNAGTYWTDPGADAEALAPCFAAIDRRVNQHFGPAILQSASMGRVYQVMSVTDYLVGHLPAMLQENGVPYMVLGPRALPASSATGFLSAAFHTFNDGVPTVPEAAESAAIRPPEPVTERMDDPSRDTLEPLEEIMPPMDAFASAAPPPPPPASPSVEAVPERKESKGGMKFKRVKLSDAGESAPPPRPPAAAPPPAPPPPPPPVVADLPLPPPVVEDVLPPPPPPPPPVPPPAPVEVVAPPPPVSAPPPPAARASVPTVAPTAGDWQPGATLYESRRGCVRTARDSALGRDVALRTASGALDELRRRAGVLERARGAGVPVVLGLVTTTAGEPALALPRYRGVSLEAVRARAASALAAPLVALDAAEWWRVADALLGALARTHAAGVVHAGLHPARITWSEEDGLLIFGWGLAGGPGDAPGTTIDPARYAAEGAPGEPVRAADSAGRPGTPGFSAPEWRTGPAAAYAPTLDVYGAAATLQFLWTGVAPGTDAPGPIPPLGVGSALERALDPDPGRRPADAAAFRRLLRRYAAV